MSKKRMIALDADYLLFICTEGKFTKSGGFGREEGSVGGKAYKEPLKPYKEKYKRLIQEVEDEISANMVGEVKGIKVFLSDPNGNFRYDIYPDYKGERPKRSKLWYRLQKWAMKKYGYVENVEADDVVAYYVRDKNWIGASFDKDLLRGVSGDWFNVYHSKRNMNFTAVGEARNFNMIQTLSGDPTDNIKGLPRVAEKTAIKLLDEFGWDWNGIVKAYESKGLTEDDAILTRRLICMNQAKPKKGSKKWTIKLFTPKKKK